jgi:GT2 family glycosyltransferase
MSPSIDIVVASYNGAAKLRRCLGSMLPQLHDAEVHAFVVLDGSTDSSSGIVESIALAHPDAITSDLIERSGLAKARNHGARLGNGEWVLFLDDDTELPDGFVAGLPAALGATDADIAGFADEPLDADGYFARSIRYLELASRRSVGQQLAVKGAALACRRRVFETLGGFDEERLYYQNEDIEFTQRAESTGYTTTYLTSPAIHHEAPGPLDYVRKSWRSMATYNGVAARHYYRVNHTLALGGIAALLGLVVLRDRGRLRPLLALGGAVTAGGAAVVVRLSGASWTHIPGIIVAVALRLPFMAFGTARYFWLRRRSEPDETPLSAVSDD